MTTLATARRSLALAAAAALLAACGGGGDRGLTGPGSGGEASSTFTGAVAGAASLTLAGDAAYAVGATSEGRGVLFSLAQDATASKPSVAIALFRADAVRPGTGTHAFADFTGDEDEVPTDRFGMLAVINGPGDVQHICMSESGTLTVTSSARGRVKGSYTVQARCHGTESEDGAGVPATFTGSFDAAGAER